MLSGLGQVLRRRPALVVGGAFVSGALLAETATATLWSDHAADWLATGSLGVAVLSSIAAALLLGGALRPVVGSGRRHPVLVACIALLLGTGAGTSHAYHIVASPVRQMATSPDRADSVVEAVVQGVGLKSDDVWMVPIKVRSVDGRRVIGRIEAVLPAEQTGGAPPLPGTRLSLTGELYLPGQQLNPYEYDARRGLVRDGLLARLKVSGFRTRRADSVLAVLAWPVRLPVQVAAWCAYRLQSQIDQVLTGDARALALAFLLGNRSVLRQSDLYTAFEASGGLHLAAVSGLHVGLVAGAFDLIGRAGRLSRTRRNALTLAVAVLYSMIAGGAPSVVRATVMVGCAKLAPRRRQPDGLNTVALAAGSLVVVNPLLAGDPGFQLSVLATLGIIAAGRWTARDQAAGWRRQFARGLQASALAQLATLPVVVHCFCRVTPAAPVTNLLLLPAGSLAVTSAFVAGCLGLIHPVLLRAAAPLLGLVLGGLALLVRSLAAVVGRPLVTGHPGVAACAIAAIATAIYLLKSWTKQRPAACVVLTMVLVLTVPYIIHRPPRALEVRFVAVGQGDCALVRAGSVALLIDCGPPGYTGAAGTSAFGRAALPFLRATLTKPGLVLISHPHADHVGGLADILRLYPAATVATREGFREDVHHVAGLAPDAGDLVRGLIDGCPLYLPAWRAGTRDIQLEIVPFWAAGLTPEAAGDDNEASMCLRLQLVETAPGGGYLPVSAAVLFTGDIGAAAENALLTERPELLSATVLKVAHHGSNGSNTVGFLAGVRPSLAIVSTGPNRFGHPGAYAWARLDAAVANVVRTDHQGMITVTMSADGRAHFRPFCP